MNLRSGLGSDSRYNFIKPIRPEFLSAGILRLRDSIGVSNEHRAGIYRHDRALIVDLGKQADRRTASSFDKSRLPSSRDTQRRIVAGADVMNTISESVHEQNQHRNENARARCFNERLIQNE